MKLKNDNYKPKKKRKIKEVLIDYTNLIKEI
jgi:hypothetical protein